MKHNERHPMSKRRSQRLIEAKAFKGGQGWDSRTVPTILTFPTETLLMVVSFLDKPWRLSLALTCKFFANLKLGLSSKPSLTFTSEERVEFLSTLQNDIPNTFFCYCCARPHQLDPDLDWRAQVHAKPAHFFGELTWQPEIITFSRHIHLPQSYRLFLDRAQITFMEVNLVMRRHFYGHSHGLSLQSLERYEAFEAVIGLDQCLRQLLTFSSRFEPSSRKPSRRATQLPGRSLGAIPRAENAWRFSFRHVPKIVDDKLYLARFINIVGPHVPMEHLNRLIATLAIPICGHLFCSADPSCCHRFHKSPLNYLRYYPLIQTTSSFSDRHDGKAVEFDPKQDSCFACSTDYDVSLNRNTSKNETSLGISVYHCLGSCRSPNDKLWAYLVTYGEDYWNFETGLPLTKDEVYEDAAPPLMFDENPIPRVRYDRSHWVQKLRSRSPVLDRGGPRRIWHEAACLG
ncbi:hypothetical protein V8C44DRAFT_368781 [Trichoderma aethiopicum]